MGKGVGRKISQEGGGNEKGPKNSIIKPLPGRRGATDKKTEKYHY